MGCQLYNTWARRHEKIDAIQKIDKQLYLACRLYSSDIDRLKHEKIGAILDVTAEFDALEWTLLDENMSLLKESITNNTHTD